MLEVARGSIATSVRSFAVGTPMDDHDRFARGGRARRSATSSLGGKFNSSPPCASSPAACRSAAWSSCRRQTPTRGVGTGKADFWSTSSSARNQRGGRALGFGGFIVRGDPDDEVDRSSNGFRWGFGVGFPTRGGCAVRRSSTARSYFDDRHHVARPWSARPMVAATWLSVRQARSTSHRLHLPGAAASSSAAASELADDDGRATSGAFRKTRRATWAISSASAITRACASTCRRRRRRHRRHRPRRRTGRRR